MNLPLFRYVQTLTICQAPADAGAERIWLSVCVPD